MKLEMYAVPDYICTGVVEHYCKVSVIVSDDQLKPMAVCSVIVNKKTGKIQRQAKVDKLDGRHIRTAVFGYGKNPNSFCAMDQIANFYDRLDDVVRNALHVCFSDLVFALNMARTKLPALAADWPNMRDCARDLHIQYLDIENGRYENTILPPASAPATYAEPTDEPAPAVIEEPAEEQRRRATRKVARMVFANGLTEFLNGNIYKIELEKDGLPNVVGTLNGKRYYSVLNANGERRYLDESRIRIEEQFTEPPMA